MDELRELEKEVTQALNKIVNVPQRKREKFMRFINKGRYDRERVEKFHVRVRNCLQDLQSVALLIQQ